MPQSKRRKAEAPLPTICVLGATGVGKGSTLNSCFHTDTFGTSHRFASDTVKPISFVLPWKGKGIAMRGVDLCGFSDSEGRDTGFIEAMVAYLRDEVQHVNCFLLLLNSQEARVGMHLKDMLVALKSVFGIGFLKNVLIGFTRWDYSRKGELLRRGVTKESLTASVNGLLREVLGHDHDCNCIFLDNTVNMCSPAELRDLYTCAHCQTCSDELAVIVGAFDEALEAVRIAATGNAPFFCADIESTVAERDVGRDMIEREEAAVEQGQAAFAGLSDAWEALGVEEPARLEESLHASARTAREALQQYLSAKCKPDLEHVRISVLEAFDAQLKERIGGVLYRNKSAAASANRALRMQLVREYKEHIAEQSQDELRAPRARFDAIYARCREVVADFVGRCQGGSLAWQPLVVLQDGLRMEQVDAREKLLRDELKAGHELPSVSERMKDADAFIRLLGAQTAPTWLLELGSGSDDEFTTEA